MSVRFVFHVGPHKTGTTSAQLTLHAHRDRLLGEGVLYPAPPPGAEHPASHAALAHLLTGGRADALLAWLEETRRVAAARGCRTVFLSSEVFAAPRAWRPLARVVRHVRRRMGSECRLIYVRRDLGALTYSMAVQRLHNQAGFLHEYAYDLRAWARHYAARKQAEERFFRRLGAVMPQLETVPRPDLTARLLAIGTDRPFADIVTGEEHVSAAKFSGSPAVLLSYPLRLMTIIARGGMMASPETHRAATALMTAVSLDETGFAALVREFETAARRAIALGIEDQARMTWAGRLIDRLGRACRILVEPIP